MSTPRVLLSAVLLLGPTSTLSGCGDDGGASEQGSEDTSTATGTSHSSGDGDGDGEGSGDGDGEGSGDGDGEGSGDGDGDAPPQCTPPAWPPASAAEDGYEVFELCGWTINMSDALYADVLAQPVYEALAEDLQLVTQLLPPAQLEFLRATKFWMELEIQAFPGGVYHPSAQWLMDNGYPPKWAEGIQFGVAQNYLGWVAQQPAMVLHELTHAWDHQRHGYNHPELLAAYDAAMAAQLYDEVEYVEGQLTEAYATTNAAEYYAELSEAYFSTAEPPEGWFNDFYPFTRAQLEAHDPVGYAAVEAAWELR